MSTVEDVKNALEEQSKGIQEFKNRYDAKLQALDNEMLEIQKKRNRLNVGGSYSLDAQESKTDLAMMIRSRGEVKGMFSGSGPDGGWTVAPVLAESIGGIARNTSAVRQLVDFIEIGTGDAYDEMVAVTPVGSTWVGETQARPGTDSPKLALINTKLHEEYAQPVISQRLADDSGHAMVDFLTGEVAMTFAESENYVLFNGNGVVQPMGLNEITAVSTADATRDFGKIQYIPTGASGAFAGTNPFDAIKKLYYALHAGYRANASWVCNSETAQELSLIKDGSGAFYLWDDQGVKAGGPPTLLGRPVVICEDAPSIAADAKALWFGDFSQAMRGIERPGNKVLLDPYSDKPNLRVYVYRRIGLQLRNSNAVKCLKFSAA